MAPIKKAAFYQEIDRLLTSDGWVRVPNVFGDPAIFARRHGPLVCTIGFTESRLFVGEVSAHFYAAGHAFYALWFRNLPLGIHVGIDFLLTEDERRALLRPRDAPLGHSAWWDRTEPESATKIVATIRLTAPRFWDRTHELEGAILGDPEHAAHVARAKAIAATPDDGASRKPGYPPASWVEMATRLTSVEPKLQAKTSLKVATDAWVTYHVLAKGFDDLPPKLRPA